MQVVHNEKKIIQLTMQRDALQSRVPQRGQSQLQMELDSLQKEYTEISRKTAEFKSNLLMDESMFGESKA